MSTREQQVQRLLESVRSRYSTPKGISHYEKGARDWGAAEWEKAMIRLFMTPPGSVLDVGCGAGRMAIELARLGYAVTGIDITPELLAVAKKLAKEFGLAITFRDCDGLELDFPDGSFQYVLLNQMIGHVPLRANRVALFRECRRVVSSTGRVVLNYDDYRIVKAERLWGSDRPPDPRAQQEADKYSILESGDGFGNPVRGPGDEDPVFGYGHEYTKEEVESELTEADLKIADHVRASELPGVPDERPPCYIVTAVP